MRKKNWIRALCGAATLCCLAPAGATALTTTLNLVTPVNNAAGATRVVYEWATPLTSGAVSTANLTDLKMQLYNGAALVYTDTVISGGVLQAFGGLARTAADVVWDFDLTSGTLAQMRNFLPGNAAGATGTQYIVDDNVTLPFDGDVLFQRVLGGTLQGATLDELSSQSTVAPEPATTALVGFGLLAVACLRRRRSDARRTTSPHRADR